MDVRFYPSAGGNSIPGEPPNLDFAHCLGYYNFNKVRRSPLTPSFVTTLLPLRPHRAQQLHRLPNPLRNKWNENERVVRVEFHLMGCLRLLASAVGQELLN